MTVSVVVESGRTKTFAVAADFPGWARSAKSTELALDALDSYRDRYCAILADAGLAAPKGRLVVAEEVRGDASTDFGVPAKVADLDRRVVRRADRDRFSAVLVASWAAFDDAAAVTGELQVGPRGGGRSVAAMVAHVAAAEAAYARKFGLRVASSDDPAAVRDRIVGVVGGTVDPDRVASWPLRYGVRRVAWHVLDHLFEMQDRAIA